jgi:Nuclease-related domain
VRDADERFTVESKSLTGLPPASTYELRPRADEVAAYAVLDENALEAIKRRLAKHLRGSGVLMLHDLAVPAAASTIDHLCIGPNGITAVDVERSPGGRDREELVHRVSRETEIVAAVLSEAGIQSDQISGAVCQTGRLKSFMPGASSSEGIVVGPPRRVAKVTRAERAGRPLDVQLALAVVRTRLGHAGQRSYAITRPTAT